MDNSINKRNATQRDDRMTRSYLCTIMISSKNGGKSTKIDAIDIRNFKFYPMYIGTFDVFGGGHALSIRARSQRDTSRGGLKKLYFVAMFRSAPPESTPFDVLTLKF